MAIMVLIAVTTDVRSGKIYNWVTVSGAAVGLILNVVGDGLPGAATSLLGLALGFVVFLVSSVFGRILGGGDIKLLMAIGAIQGPAFLAYTLAAMAFAGGLLAVGVALWHGDLLPSLRRLYNGLFMRAVAKIPVDIAQSKATTRLPYAIPIALGSFAAVYFTMLPHV